MRAALLADGRRQAVDADRAAVELLDDGQQQLAVEHVEALRIDLQHVERRERRPRRSMMPGRLDLREIAHPAQQPVGDARRAARALGDAQRAVGLRSRASRIAAERVTMSVRSSVRVELEPLHDAEAVAQRRGQQPGARGRARPG